VPSFSADPRTLRSIPGIESWPERQLIELRHLRGADNRLVLVTPAGVSEACLEAVLELLPGAPAGWLRRRLRLVNLDDRSPRPLAQKLLERPRLLERLRRQLRPGAVLATYAVGEAEGRLAERLGLRLQGSPSALSGLGSKAGSAAVFAELGLAQPATTPLCHSLSELEEAIAALALADPTLETLLVKLNCMAGGRGNARLPLALRGWRSLARTQRCDLLRRALDRLAMPLPHWREEMEARGAIAQALITPESGSGPARFSSPSVQLWIDGRGTAEVVSSHEQLLAGPQGLSYVGCRFPARAAYRCELMAIGRRLGEHLARLGCRGPVLLDLLARRDPQGWRLWAIEINLRKGGTTHPFLLAASLAGRGIDPDSGLLLAPDGCPLFYEAGDAISRPQWRGLRPEQLLDAMVRQDCYLDHTRLQGCIPHRLGALAEHGLLGVTVLGHSRRDAAARMRRLLQLA